MEYIHFLDSDDWLELNCIEECVKIALYTRAEVVWHGYESYNEISGEIVKNTYLKDNGFMEGEILSGGDVFNRLRTHSFAWVWSGLINEKKIKKLRFLDGIIGEDVLFGIQLFSLSRRIVIKKSELMFYRIRPNSLSQYGFDNNLEKFSYPKNCEDLVCAFGNTITVSHYNYAYSYAKTCVELDKFLKQGILEKPVEKKLLEMLQFLAVFAFGGCGFGKDPRGVRQICSQLTPYMRKVHLRSKIAYFFPQIFNFLRYCKKLFIKKIKIF